MSASAVDGKLGLVLRPTLPFQAEKDSKTHPSTEEERVCVCVTVCGRVVWLSPDWQATWFPGGNLGAPPSSWVHRCERCGAGSRQEVRREMLGCVCRMWSERGRFWLD